MGRDAHAATFLLFRSVSKRPPMPPRLLLVLFFLLVNLMLFAQPRKGLDLPATGGSLPPDSGYAYVEATRLVALLGLPDLRQSRDPFHLRLWLSSQAVDLWVDSAGRHHGSVCSYALRDTKQPLYQNGYFAARKAVAHTTALPAKLARQLLDSVYALRIFDPATGRPVPAWAAGLDGLSYPVETATAADYHLRSYWSPLSVYASPEERAVAAFLKAAGDLLPLQADLGRLRVPAGYRLRSQGGISGVILPTDWSPKIRIQDWF